MEDLTSVFEMGTGVAFLLWPPEKHNIAIEQVKSGTKRFIKKAIKLFDRLVPVS